MALAAVVQKEAPTVGPRGEEPGDTVQGLIRYLQSSCCLRQRCPRWPWRSLEGVGTRKGTAHGRRCHSHPWVLRRLSGYSPRPCWAWLPASFHRRLPQALIPGRAGSPLGNGCGVEGTLCEPFVASFFTSVFTLTRWADWLWCYQEDVGDTLCTACGPVGLEVSPGVTIICAW